MKRREIAIELTALLDVILIMLFWALFNMEQEVETVKEDAYEQIEEYQRMYNDAASELEIVREQYDSIVSLYSESAAAANQKALDDFEEGHMISIALSPESGARLSIFGDSGTTERILAGTKREVASIILQALSDAGYEKGDVIICIFLNDPAEISYNAREKIYLAVDIVREQYENIYFTDLVSASR